MRIIISYSSILKISNINFHLVSTYRVIDIYNKPVYSNLFFMQIYSFKKILKSIKNYLKHNFNVLLVISVK